MSDVYILHAEATASRLVANEAVIVKLPDGEMTVLNESASLLWALADGTRTADDLAAELQSRYGLDQAPDVTAILRDLTDAGLLAESEQSTESRETITVPEATAYEAPALKARELLEALASTCNSGWGGYVECMQDAGCITQF